MYFTLRALSRALTTLPALILTIKEGRDGSEIRFFATRQSRVRTTREVDWAVIRTPYTLSTFFGENDS